MVEEFHSFECAVTSKSKEGVRVRMIDLTSADDHALIDIPFSSLPFGARDVSIGQSFFWDITPAEPGGESMSCFYLQSVRETANCRRSARARELAIYALSLDMSPTRMH